MVCKEDVLLWFKDLDSYKRIDVMHDLLKMCLPFELRFLGSCVEEMGKHSYQELRGPSLLANDYDKLAKDSSLLNQNLLDESVRHRVILYLSLLDSRNYTVSNFFYKNYLRTECVDEFLFKTNNNSLKNDFTLSEFLLLYMMALHHPAFNFEQKMYFGNLLNRLVEHKENNNKKRVSPKPSTTHNSGAGGGYHSSGPPGFDPGLIKANNYDLKVQGMMHAPPNRVVAPPMDYVPNLWNRPVHCGAPEVPPFPPPPSSISPLVSQASTPTHSRCTSPPRSASIVNVQLARQPPIPPPTLAAVAPPPPLVQIPTNLDSSNSTTIAVVAPPPPLPVIDPSAPPPVVVTHSSLTPKIFGNNDLKLPEDELSQLSDTQQLMDTPPWISRVMPTENAVLKPMNGLCCYPPQFKIPPTPYLVEQMHALSLEGENSLHHSNSSSNSSLNQSPPETPTVATPHGPGRGGVLEDSTKSRVTVNGIPSTNFHHPLCDSSTQQPQQQQPPFSNCTVPYTSYPPPAAAGSFNQMAPQPPPPSAQAPASNNRSIFQFTTTQPPPPPFCRPNFSSNLYQNFQSPETNAIPPPPTYTVPYVSIIYSSPQYPARPPTGCYNCGAREHVGNDCTAQNIEEITQKKTYSLDYNNTTIGEK